MRTLSFGKIERLELTGVEATYDLKRISEEIDYAITINKKSKIIKSLQRVFKQQRIIFYNLILEINSILNSQLEPNEDLIILRENLYTEYCNFLDHIVILKNKGNILDDIRIMFNKEISNDIPLVKSDIDSVKNYEVMLNYVFRENLNIKKNIEFTKTKIKKIVNRLASITKFIESNKLYPSYITIEIEYILNLIFRYLTLLEK